MNFFHRPQAAKETGWAHVSVGGLLRAAAEAPRPRGDKETALLRERIAAGEMAPLDMVMRVVESHVAADATAPGVILDGFPRDSTQAAEFEAKVSGRSFLTSPIG